MVTNKYMQIPNSYKRFLLVYNPVEGRKKAHKRLQQVVKRLLCRNCSFEVIESKDLHERTDIQSFDSVVAVGGDGTVLSIVSVLSKYDIKLGIIPNGTANLFASGLNIPRNIDKAIDILFDGKMSMVDIGKAGEQYFALRVGVGYDADIVNGAGTFLKDRIGYLAYLIEGFKSYFRQSLKKIKITIDGKTLEVDANSVIVANAGNMFRNLFTIAPQTSTIDGKLDVFILTSKSVFDFLKVLYQILSGRHTSNSSVIYDKGSNIKIETKDINTHIDGEPWLKNTLDISVIPRALKVLVPAPVRVPAYKKVLVEV
ncbi:MAG: diacylglycerol kinase family protein [Cyanobacteriota bacterium]